ncbi:Boletus edulis lectin [Grifola frondosa]|uniref:Boletus edulis lectin n=1 Tax=Grifola frondosa TaxID=5627 RepID=A0A1C7ML99_GRIFR|nr:Boletus edulis lectin [Grifola frondosa]
MSYTLTVTTVQPQPPTIQVVEKTVWYYADGGIWTGNEQDGPTTLTMNGSGTSGTLRFMTNDGDFFVVALGINGYVRWCDIVTDLAAGNTGLEIHPTYYNDGERTDARNKNLSKLEKTDKQGRKIAVEYTAPIDNTYSVTITITVT